MRGIDLGIIIALIGATVTGTAYVVGLETEIERLSADSAAHVRRLEAQIERLSTDSAAHVRRLETEIERLSTEGAVHEAEIGRLGIEVVELSNRIDTFRVSTGSLPAGALVRFIRGRGCPDEGDWDVVIIDVHRQDDRTYCERQRPAE